MSCGPPDIGQGGYVAGVLAGALGGSDVTVSLRAPAPLGRDLMVDTAGEGATLSDGDTLIAEASRALLSLDIPPPPTLAEAEAASARFDRAAHLYPGCFVCGPGRAEGDGWRIFPGPIGDGRVAATWTSAAPPSVRELWAALDCPGAYATGVPGRGVVVLGQLAARIDRVPGAGEECVVVGRGLGSDGRKHGALTALFSAEGELLALARAVWIEPRL